jgi:hypothetical protein
VCSRRMYALNASVSRCTSALVRPGPTLGLMGCWGREGVGGYEHARAYKHYYVYNYFMVCSGPYYTHL